MFTSDTTRQVAENLQPAPEIKVPEERDTGAIEEAAQTTERAEQTEAQARGAEANSALFAGRAVSSMALNAAKLDEQYQHNTYNSFLGQLEGLHKSASEQIQQSNDPAAIQQIASHASAVISGLMSNESGLPKGLQSSLKLASDNYANAIHQAATVKSNRLAVDNTLLQYNNTTKPFYSNVDASLRNEEDPRKRQLIVKQVVDRMDSLESLYSRATTQEQRNKIAGLINQGHTWIWAQNQPNTPVPDIGVSEALTSAGANHIKQGEAAKNSVLDGFNGGDPRDMSYEDASSNPDYRNGFIAAQQGRMWNGAIANSHSIPQDIARMKNSDSYSAHLVADHLQKEIKNGNADQIAWATSPQIRDAHNKMITTDATSSQYQSVVKDYQQKLKTWMNYHGMPDSSYNPLTQDQREFFEASSQQTSKEDADPNYVKQVNSVRASMASVPSAFIGGSGWANDALRLSRFSNFNVKEGNITPSFPQEFNNLFNSFSPTVQKEVAQNKNLFADPDTFKGIEYNNFAGKSAHIRNINDLSTFVQQNASSFKLASLSTASGNSMQSLIKSTSTLIAMKVSKGEDASSAIEDVKNEYNEMLTAHPIVSGKSDEGFRVQVNPEVVQSYGAPFVNPNNYVSLLGRAANDTYDRMVEQNNLQFSRRANEKETVQSKVDRDLTRSRNIKYLGDKQDAHVISSNGRLYLRTANGRTFPIRSDDMKRAAEEVKKSQETASSLRSKELKTLQDIEALQFATPFR